MGFTKMNMRIYENGHGYSRKGAKMQRFFSLALRLCGFAREFMIQKKFFLPKNLKTAFYAAIHQSFRDNLR